MIESVCIVRSRPREGKEGHEVAEGFLLKSRVPLMSPLLRERKKAGPTCSVPEDEARIAVGDALVIHDVIPNAACIGFTEIPIVSI